MEFKKKDDHIPDYARVERQEMLIGLGYADNALERPQIGVVSSWGEINPAAANLDRVVASVKDGIWAAGGTPREFVISSLCTSMAGNDNYHLPHRDIIAAYIEAAVLTNLFDGMVFVPVCDDVVPGHLMAAARLDLPSIFITGGYMPTNRYKGEILDPLAVAPRYYKDFKQKKLDQHDYYQMRNRACPGAGACPVMGTANTMASMVEALGMSLPGTAVLPGSDSRLLRAGFDVGRQIVKLLHQDIKASQIMTFNAFKNAIRLLMAIGGSPNAVLHLTAIASELGLEIQPDTFNAISKETPFICDVAPSGSAKYNLGDLDEAGGIPCVMKELMSLLDTDVMTVTGHSLERNLEIVQPGDRKVIFSIEEPIDREGGLLFLRGNLAPDGALIKRSAVPKALFQHKGPAKIFRTEDNACDALDKDEIKPGDVVIVRNVGVIGAPGMGLQQRFLWQLSAKGYQDKVAFITDGRLSGTNKGCAVAHVTPEAAVGGPLAIVEEGDIIEIDVINHQLNVVLSLEKIEERYKNWKPSSQKPERGFLSIYVKMAKSADKGSALNYG